MYICILHECPAVHEHLLRNEFLKSQGKPEGLKKNVGGTFIYAYAYANKYVLIYTWRWERLKTFQFKTALLDFKGGIVFLYG